MTMNLNRSDLTSNVHRIDIELTTRRPNSYWWYKSKTLKIAGYNVSLPFHVEAYLSEDRYEASGRSGSTFDDGRATATGDNPVARARIGAGLCENSQTQHTDSQKQEYGSNPPSAKVEAESF